MSNTVISELIPISISTLQPADAAGMDLYHKIADSDEFALYCAADHPLLETGLNSLKNRGVKKLYIQSQCRNSYQSRLRSLFESEQELASLGPRERAAALNAVVLDVLENLFDEDIDDESVNEVSKLGQITADIVCENSFAAKELFDVLHHDYATFTHSTNVSLYAAILAAELGLPQSDIESIATAALLHDLGKLTIDNQILCKPGKLTDDEFRQIKMHPTVGFDILRNRENLSWGQLMVVYQHHERIDGRGYPVGVTGNEIHLWAKICSIVDVYEALTSYRPYRGPMPRAKAIEIMSRDSDKAFDEEMLKCWVKATNCNSKAC